MAKVYEFLANGFEEIEGLAPVDILRRGGIDATTVSITGSREVTTSHGVTILADTTFEDAGEMADADLLMLPGGMPGSTNLNAHAGVLSTMRRQFDSGKLVAAICAAPMVLGTAGILQGKRATCSPGFQKYLTGAEYTRRAVYRRRQRHHRRSDHAQHCLTPIRFCRFSLAKRKRGHWKRRCNTPI